MTPYAPPTASAAGFTPRVGCVVGLVGPLLIFGFGFGFGFGDERRCLHDLVADTVALGA